MYCYSLLTEFLRRTACELLSFC